MYFGKICTQWDSSVHGILWELLVHNVIKMSLKGEYEDYTWGYGQNPLSLLQISFSSVDPSCLAIGKTILVRSLIFHIFTRVENQPLKQRLKQKRRIILTNLQNIFSFVKL